MRLVIERNRPSLRMSVGSGLEISGRVYEVLFSPYYRSVFGKDVFDSEEDPIT